MLDGKSFLKNIQASEFHFKFLCVACFRHQQMKCGPCRRRTTSPAATTTTTTTTTSRRRHLHSSSGAQWSAAAACTRLTRRRRRRRRVVPPRAAARPCWTRPRAGSRRWTDSPSAPARTTTPPATSSRTASRTTRPTRWGECGAPSRTRTPNRRPSRRRSSGATSSHAKRRRRRCRRAAGLRARAAASSSARIGCWQTAPRSRRTTPSRCTCTMQPLSTSPADSDPAAPSAGRSWPLKSPPGTSAAPSLCSLRGDQAGLSHKMIFEIILNFDFFVQRNVKMNWHNLFNNN